MNLVKLLGLSCALSIGLLGCSTLKEDMVPAKLQKVEASYRFKNEWRNFVGVGQDARYSRLQPTFVDGALYTVDVKGHLLKLDPLTGDITWTLDLETGVGGGVGSGGGFVFVGSLSGEVIAIDPVLGIEKWRAQTSSEIVSSPQANSDVVIVSAIDSRVFAFDIKDGSPRWNYDHPAPILSLRTTGAPLVKGDNAFIGFDNGQLLNFNCANGQLVWSARVGQPKGKTELDRLVDIDANPIEYGPYIYGAGYNSRIIAVSRGSGTVMWAQDMSTSQNIVASDNVVVAVDEKSHLKAYDALTGTVLWESDLLHRRGVSAPVIISGMIVVIDYQGIIHSLSLKTGETLAQYHSRHDSVLAQPVVFGDLIYILDTRGEIAAFSLNSLKAIPAVTSEAQ